MDSKKEEPKNNAYLLKDILLICIAHGKNAETKEDQGSIVLYEAQKEEFKNYRNVMDNADISDVVERALKSTNEKTCIEMKLTYDKISETFKTAIQTTLDKAFVRKLKSALASPTLTIEGTFRVLYLQNDAWQSFDSVTKYFYVSGIALRDQIIENFSGSSEMVSFCNQSQEKSYIALKYSMLLEWQDLRLDLQREKLNVLEKLWSDKILTDCCIVAANKAEMSCHRNILAAQSDVFYTMLTSQFQESRTNRIEMCDVSEEGVKALLDYLYKWDVKVEEMTEQIFLEAPSHISQI
ncbi:Speckle-type POZ protein [Orchesella cincta]|uniref:Speckle-type POZ protein n=1 Tax=Orchesella cincta TaxID=48709 RepID=A0A1D2M9V2_ORCCI|nr:Speckle-type POZ protein [Orchesella cincta]